MIGIITAPAQVLSQKTTPIQSGSGVDKNIHNLINEMKQTLLLAKDPEGVGLAAPQVGKPLSVFIIKPTPKSPIKVFVNPKIIEEKDNLASPSSKIKSEVIREGLRAVFLCQTFGAKLKENQA